MSSLEDLLLSFIEVQIRYLHVALCIHMRMINTLKVVEILNSLHFTANGNSTCSYTCITLYSISIISKYILHVHVQISYAGFKSIDVKCR